MSERPSQSSAGLTTGEQRQVVTAADAWRRGGPFDEHIGGLFAAVEAILAARLAAVEALADEWEHDEGRAWVANLGDQLRAALTAAEPAPVSGAGEVGSDG